jgi:hypothetical protein
MAKNEQAVSATEQVEQRERKWLKPTKRAAGYAEERKKGVHMRGPKKGQELDAYNKGLRSGYLLAQSDNAGMHKYKQARDAGAEKADAQAYSKTVGKEAGESFWAKLMKRLKGK